MAGPAAACLYAWKYRIWVSEGLEIYVFILLDVLHALL